MPLKNVRYRWVDPGKPGGPKVRLAFRGGSTKKRTGTVVEAKSSTGKIHTQEEFRQDRLRSKTKKKALRGRKNGRTTKFSYRT